MSTIKELISIEEYNLNRLKAIGTINKLRCFVEGKSDVFFPHLPVLDTGTSEVKIYKVKTGIYDMNISIKFKKLSKSDKIEIEVYNELASPEQRKLTRRFYPESALKEFTPSLVREVDMVRYRMKFLIPLALSAVISGSSASVFAYNQDIGSRLIRVKHEDIYTFTRKYISYTGDFNTDFQSALLSLWFNYPVDMTGFDEKIKRITLEEMTL